MKRLARIGFILTLLAGLMMVTSQVFAGGYPPGSPALQTDNNTPSEGQTIHVSGDGFEPGSTVTVTIDGHTVGTFTVDANGHFVGAITIPSGICGRQTILATGIDANGDPLVLSSIINVTCGVLTKTGTDILPIALAGFAVIALGGLLLLVRRRRSPSDV